jgi:subfamily B ATP-binding cassette protein MsbA
MTPGDFFSILTAIVMAFAPLKKLGGAYAQLQETLGVFERVDHFLNQQQEESRGQALDGLRGEIRYENVSFSYPGTDTQVLQEIDITIPAGKIFAIVGPSGAGKSTLVDLIPRFYNPTSGRILWDGADLRKISLTDLRHQMAIVTQDVLLFSDTIFENIAAGRPGGATMEEVENAARIAQAHDFIAALPQGYDTMLEERGLNLSGGQRQRIALARAVLRNPPLLILDEATSALDSVSEKAIQKALEEVMKGRTTIVIAHRLSTIIHADQVIVIDKGRIMDRGTHKELMESSALYQELYQTWASSDEKIVNRMER